MLLLFFFHFDISPFIFLPNTYFPASIVMRPTEDSGLARVFTPSTCLIPSLCASNLDERGMGGEGGGRGESEKATNKRRRQNHARTKRIRAVKKRHRVEHYDRKRRMPQSRSTLPHVSNNTHQSRRWKIWVRCLFFLSSSLPCWCVVPVTHEFTHIRAARRNRKGTCCI